MPTYNKTEIPSESLSDRDRIIKRLKDTEGEMNAWDENPVRYNGFIITKQINCSSVPSTRYIAGMNIVTRVTTPADRHLAFYMGHNGKLNPTSSDNFFNIETLLDLIDALMYKNLYKKKMPKYLKKNIKRKFKGKK